LTLFSDKIAELINNMEKEVKQIKSDILKMTWFMRGGLTYDQALNLSLEERNLVSEIIKENLETAKKTGMPFF
jgi:glutamate formiminotransferase